MHLEPILRRRPLATLLCAAMACGAARGDGGYLPVNSQKPGDEPPPAAELVATLELPEGFGATVFAAEPDVRQPVSMCFDDRGRLWVAECYSYGEWARRGEDRLTVYEDLDHDGRSDRRTVFWDKANHLSSVLVGFGGVWMLDLPELWFIPDADGDLVPDGPPVKKLVGFTTEGGHNMANGLSWGPDGWLYGRHGITASSRIGRPGSADHERVHMNPGLWRLHPADGRFETVLHGMTNPWGHDWDEHGHLFISGNVNGHLWFGIPGAFYERMFGAGEFPFAFDRLQMIGDHPHYPGDEDWKKVWNKDDIGRSPDHAFGGGHSHAGALIYQGDNWPAEYRGDIFMCNTHGRRVNRDRIRRHGSTFQSSYLGDVARAHTPWFRGSAIVAGPDGGVYVSDWTDLGECHDHDGVHRTSGRILKITHGQPAPPETADLNALDDAALAALHGHENVWWARAARRLLQERDGARDVEPAALDRLREQMLSGPTAALRLRAVWSLWGVGALTEPDLLALLESGDEHERSWAVRLLCERGGLRQGTLGRLNATAADDPSGLVKTYLATALRRLPPDAAWPVATQLAASAGPQRDETFERVLWFGLEPLVAAAPSNAVAAIGTWGSSRLRRGMAHRVAAGWGTAAFAGPVRALMAAAGPGADPGLRSDVLEGFRGALQGRKNVAPPSGWAAVRAAALAGGDDEDRRRVFALAAVFRDEAVFSDLKAGLRDGEADPEVRAAALQGLVDAGAPDARALAEEALEVPALRPAAIAALGRLGGDDVPQRVLALYPDLGPDARVVAVGSLLSRREWAGALLEAVGEGTVARSDLSPSDAQRVQAFHDGALDGLLAAHWGAARGSPEEKLEAIDRHRAMLSSGELGEPDLSAGRDVYRRACAACHRLFGEGGTMGPDLTGSGRRDLDYLLQNIIDPSAVVPTDYWISFVTLADGRVLSGTIPLQTDNLVVLKTAAGEQRLDRKEVTSIERTYSSQMPEGILDTLTPQEIRDLIAYMQSEGGAP